MIRRSTVLFITAGILLLALAWVSVLTLDTGPPPSLDQAGTPIKLCVG
jgi:hypothetical protein